LCGGIEKLVELLRAAPDSEVRVRTLSRRFS
jgi:hypothetical protein